MSIRYEMKQKSKRKEEEDFESFFDQYVADPNLRPDMSLLDKPSSNTK